MGGKQNARTQGGCCSFLVRGLDRVLSIRAVGCTLHSTALVARHGHRRSRIPRFGNRPPLPYSENVADRKTDRWRQDNIGRTEKALQQHVAHGLGEDLPAHARVCPPLQPSKPLSDGSPSQLLLPPSFPPLSFLFFPVPFCPSFPSLPPSLIPSLPHSLTPSLFSLTRGMCASRRRMRMHGHHKKVRERIHARS